MKDHVGPVVMLVLAGSLAGCGGFQLVRAPRSDLWKAPHLESPVIELPEVRAATALGRAQHDDVSALIQLVDAEQTQTRFGVDLIRHQIQPLLVVIHNSSPRAYAIGPTAIAPRPIPAAHVAQLASPHPITLAAEHARWLTWLLPGVVVESLIEPLTIDFPGIEEAAQRPALPNPAAVKAEFVRHELPEMVLEPDHTASGVVFVRPFHLGEPVIITLTDRNSRQPLRLSVPTTAAPASEHRPYPQSLTTVWRAVIRAASGLPTWHVVSVDADRHVLKACAGLRVFRWSSRFDLTVTVEPAGRFTQVQVSSEQPGALSTAYGRRSPTLDAFWQALDGLLPRPVIRPPPTSGTPTAAPLRRFGPRGKIERSDQPSGSY